MTLDQQFTENQTVVDPSGNKGVITMAFNGEYEIRWSNGMTGSFTQAQITSNGIVAIDA